MNQARNSGAIRMALILNVLLVLSIGAAIYYLMNQLNQPTEQVQSSPVAPAAPTAPAIAATQPGPAQAEAAQPEPVLSEEDIAKLKQQLEQEQSKLTTLREEQELIEQLRQETSLNEAVEGQTSQAPAALITPMGFPERPPQR